MPVFPRRTIVLAAFLVGTAGAAAAQQTELTASKKASVSPTEQVAKAEATEKRGNQLAARITKMLDAARREKDIMKANCLNRKLTEVNATVRNVGQRLKALKEAKDGNDAERGNHEFTVVTVLATKLDTLDQEASQCLGQDVYNAGASQVITTVDPTTTTDNPFSVGADSAPPPSVTVPPPLSPKD